MKRKDWKRMHRRPSQDMERIRRLIIYIVLAILLIGLGIIRELNKSWEGFSLRDYEHPIVFKRLT